jgi:hypothetical protein
MIIPMRSHKDAFKRIQQRGVQQACAVVIFVSNECDSLGTLKILTARLSSACILHDWRRLWKPCVHHVL